ncbi:MAG: hypothetical protein BGO69_04820 [Bacteroidetes bacterium 46-16]|nr:MAG: hypothetical protein BGO69_04820 [Bacteroidetes bacterium 46-16]
MIIWCLPHICGAQYSIEGSIKNSNDEMLPGAYILLNNGIRKVNAYADSEGHFFVEGLAKGRYSVIVNYVGYVRYSNTFEVSDDFRDVGVIRLLEDTALLEEVTIADVTPVIVKDDTIEYNAKAYKIFSGADGIDLVQKLPGLSIAGSNVNFNGEQVIQVLIDGKAIYSTNPVAALQNMPADLISRVEVYDDRGEQEKFTGFKNGNGYKTINIKTNIRGNTVFGKAKAICNIDKNYNADIGINDFKKTQRISGSVQYGTLQPEIIGTSYASPGTGKYRSGRMSLNYVNRIFNKVDLSVAYFLNNNHVDREQDEERQYIIAPDSGYTVRDRSVTATNNTTHMFVCRIDYDIDSLNSIYFKPQIELLKSHNNTDINGETLYNVTSSNISSGLQGINYAEELLWKHRLRNAGQTLSIAINFSGSSTNNNDTNYFYTAPTNGLGVDTFGRIKTAKTIGSTEFTNIAYTRKTGTSSKLLVECSLNRFLSKSPGNILDNYAKNANDNNEQFNIFEKQYFVKGGAGIQYDKRRTQFTLSLYWQEIISNNVQKQIDSVATSRTYHTLLPVITYAYKLKKNSTLRAHFSETTILPSLTQLDKLIDYNDPYVLYSGNSLLNQAYISNLGISYNVINKRESSTLLVLLNMQYIHNYIGNFSFVANIDTFTNNVLVRKGAIFNSYMNMNGYWNLGFHISYTVPAKFLKSLLTISPVFNITRVPDCITWQMRYSNKYYFGFNAILNSNISNDIDFRLVSGTNIYLSTPITGTIDPGYIKQNFSAACKLTFRGFTLDNDFLASFLFNKTTATQDNIWWNISLERKISKDQRGSLQFLISDLLNNTAVKQYSNTDMYMVNTVGKSRGRNCLLSFSYKIEKRSTSNHKNDL